MLLEADGLTVPIGARVAYVYRGAAERIRFARFIASGLAEGDKCVILTDEEGRGMFLQALTQLGIEVELHELAGDLVIITDYVSLDAVESIAASLFDDARGRYSFMRCINDTSWMVKEGWTEREFMLFEEKGHQLCQFEPCTVVCQYDTTWAQRNHLDVVVSAHQFTIVSSTVEAQSADRPLPQIVFDSMGEQLRALTRLQELSLRLGSSLSLDATLDAIIEAAMTICRAERGAISHMNEAGEFVLMRHRGLSQDYIDRRQITRFDPVVSKVVSTKLPVIIEDVEAASESLNFEAWKREGIISLVTLPLISEGEVFGLIGAGSGTVRRYTRTETDAMIVLAAQASAAITNARLFEKFSQANRAKDEFLASLSHELRTPLTPILGWVHLLKPFSKTDPMLAQGIQAIDRNARQQAGLINDLLDLTRIISGKIELQKEPTDLTTLVEAATDQIRPSVESRGIDLRVSLPPHAVFFSIDPVRLQQVLSNLFSNALKFTPDGGIVWVTVERNAAGDVQIEVADNGIGIDPAFLPYIFDRFTQAEGGINRRYGGLGLGLAITRAMVEMHGGKVSARSDGAGYGSAFTVWLPSGLAKDAEEQRKAWQSGDHILERLGLRVLLIEDSADTLEMLKLWLESFGCEVFTATDSVGGLTLAIKHFPDLIISDIGMPDIDGYELIKRVRATAGLENVPAIALTGYAQTEDQERAVTAGYTAHVAKPAEMNRLLKLIRKLTQRVN